MILEIFQTCHSVETITLLQNHDKLFYVLKRTGPGFEMRLVSHCVKTSTRVVRPRGATLFLRQPATNCYGVHRLFEMGPRGALTGATWRTKLDPDGLPFCVAFDSSDVKALTPNCLTNYRALVGDAAS